MAKATSSVLKEDVDPNEIQTSKLTNDCYFVYLDTGRIDLNRGGMTCIFDDYHDRKLTVTRIAQAGGTRNPKNSAPEFE